MNIQGLLSQVMLGLINGSFYAMLSLGLAVIFGLLQIANFTHGAQYMLGAITASLLLSVFGVNYWVALVIVPILVGISGVIVERLFLSRIYNINHMYGVLLTFGLSMIIEGLLTTYYGSSGTSYAIPKILSGGYDLGFMFLPLYRAWVIVAAVVVCLATWYVIERTALGSKLRAATENAPLVEAFGLNVPLLMTLTYAGGVGLAGLAGVMAVPIYQASPHMGHDIIVVIFAVVVIGGMGSVRGSIAAGFMLGLVEGLTKYFYPPASSTAIFVIMAVLLLYRPQGLFGSTSEGGGGPKLAIAGIQYRGNIPVWLIAVVLIAIGIALPHFIYPYFLTKALCYAIFVCAFNLLAGYAGLVSFGHAAFFGASAYVVAQAAKLWGIPPELMLLLGGLTGGILGLLFGWLALRRQGIAFAMITLALAQIVYFYFAQAPWTEGENGLQNVPVGNFLGILDMDSPITSYYVIGAVFLICFGIVWRMIHSPFGMVLKAIRDNEGRAISLGYNVLAYKLIVFVVSATLSGVAGACLTIGFRIATQTAIHFMMSGEVLLMALLGGIGTMLGPIVGAVIMTTMERFLAPFGSWIMVSEGLIFVACVMLFRRGIIGEVIAFLNRFNPHSQGGAEPDIRRPSIETSLPATSKPVLGK